MNKDKIRNIAVIAHVDHGKTTLLNGILEEAGILNTRKEIEDRVMDSDAQEKERGITILSKNTSINYNGYKINIIDTPGHSDFGGEVERVLKMVDGVLLLVDAVEGTMPQTRIVLQKALNLNLTPIVVINKIDRPQADPKKALESVYELFIDLDATEEQLDFPVIYASGKAGFAKENLEDESDNLKPLLDSIIKNIPEPKVEMDGPFKMLVSNIDYDDYVGRIAVGRIERGTLKLNMQVCLLEHKGTEKMAKITKIYTFDGLNKKEENEAKAGDIVSISGITDVEIGDTICDPEHKEKIDFVDIDKPTITMNFLVNDGPLAGQDGKNITSRQIKERLFKEAERNISLVLEETDRPDTFKVSGRGQLHLTVLIENMRREGYEILVSKPQAVIREIDGKKMEPMEEVLISAPDEYTGTIIEELGRRKGEMTDMRPSGGGYTTMTFKIPARGLIGYESKFMTDTKGLGVMNHVFLDYEEYKGAIASRSRGSIVAFLPGKSITYGLYNAQDKGDLFIGAGEEVYEGMVVGINSRPEDLSINVCKEKKLTNVRASASDDALTLVPPIKLTLEKAIEYISDDELVEVTPHHIRIRKKILNTKERERSSRNKA